MARHRQRARERKQREIHRENVPGELDHVSGEVDEAEASIVAGAQGEPVEEIDDAELTREAVGDGGEGDGGEPPGAARSAGAPAAGPKPGGSRVMNFLRASWAELQRVQWPDRRQTGQGTAVVLGFVVIAGAYLGAADALAQVIIDFIL
jgi:preprotein translocase subunit SecE